VVQSIALEQGNDDIGDTAHQAEENHQKDLILYRLHKWQNPANPKKLEMRCFVGFH
jgi:hypothetical protein